MRIIPAAIMAGILALSMGGQQPPPVSAPGGVTFTSNTNLVIVDVTVKDKSGKAIPSACHGAPGVGNRSKDLGKGDGQHHEIDPATPEQKPS